VNAGQERVEVGDLEERRSDVHRLTGVRQPAYDRAAEGRLNACVGELMLGQLDGRDRGLVVGLGELEIGLGNDLLLEAALLALEDALLLGELDLACRKRSVASASSSWRRS